MAVISNVIQGARPAAPHTAAAPHLPEPYVVNSIESSKGHLRYASKPTDVSVLAEPITFPFSGLTAKNRFLKAPMTERLCSWNKEDEDIVSTPL